MAEPLGQGDYDWFTPADLKRVIQGVHKLDDWHRFVLVGGQALTAWVTHYQIELPPFEGPYLTADADFLGTKAEAEVIAKHLESTAQIPKVDDHTPNAATIDFKGASGKKLHIDILSGVLGLEPEQVRKLAVSVQIGDYEPISVLHPLLVLESRCVNLERLSEKRHGNGITQARVACIIAERYLADCLAVPERRKEALRAARRISALASSSAGVFVWTRWQIDVLGVVHPCQMPGQFSKSWRYDLEKVTRKREIAARRTADRKAPGIMPSGA